MNKYTFSEIEIGTTHEFTVQITQDLVTMFSQITGDKNPLHTDLEFAKNMGQEKVVVFGQLVQSYLSTLAGMYLPGKYSLIVQIESNFKRPVFIEDKITIKGIVTQKINFGNLIVLETKITNQNQEVVVNGKMKVKVLK